MRINFTRLHLHGFLSFGDSDLILSDRGFVTVRGINENPNDNTLSNGSGKSSIWEAISWAITGETIRGTKDVVNINTSDGCYVELWFDCDGKSYHLIRSKDSSVYKTNLKIYIDGNDMSGKGIADSKKLLLKYLPDLTPQLLGSVIILGQGLPQKFSNNTPAGRKEILEQLSKSDFMICDLKDKISSRKDDLSSKLRKIEDFIISLNSQKSTAVDYLAEEEKQLSEMPDPQQYVESINAFDESLGKATVFISTYNDMLAQLNSDYSKLSDTYREFSYKKSTLIESVDNKYADTIDKFVQDISNITAQIQQLRVEINRIDSIKDVCPTCGQKLPNIVKLSSDSQKSELKCLNESLNQAQQKKSDIAEVVRKEKEIISANIESESFSTKSKMEEINKQISDVQNTLTRAYEKQSDYISRRAEVKTKLDNYQYVKSHHEDNILRYKQNISDLEEKILYNTNERDNILAHLKVIEKFNTIVARDFRGYLLESVISYINKRAQEYSIDIFNTDKISFILDGNNINISYGGRSMESLSGGERQKVDLIVQFSIRDMLCEFLDFSSNILVLDEIFDQLDFSGCQKMINLISKNLCDIDSVYIISHHTDLQIPSDMEITVIKNKDGVSEIRN